jgi:hypothetical protein
MIPQSITKTNETQRRKRRIPLADMDPPVTQPAVAVLTASCFALACIPQINTEIYFLIIFLATICFNNDFIHLADLTITC